MTSKQFLRSLLPSVNNGKAPQKVQLPCFAMGVLDPALDAYRPSSLNDARGLFDNSMSTGFADVIVPTVAVITADREGRLHIRYEPDNSIELSAWTAFRI